MSEASYNEVRIGPKTTSIPEHWEVKRIEEIFNIHAGGDVQEENYSETKDEDYSYPIYANSTENDGLYGYSSEFKYPEGSVTITGRGDLGHAIFRSEKFNAAVRVVVLTPSEDLDGRFFAYYINGDVDFPRESTGVPQLTRPQVAKTEVCYPPLFEQRRIADILSTVDEQIQQTEEIIEMTGELKRGLAHDLYGGGASDDQFPGRAPKLPDGWSLKPISELCDIGGGKTPSKSNDQYWGGDILWASPKDFDGPLLEDTEDKITKFGVNDTSLRTYSPGSIAIVVRSGVLRHTLPVAKLNSKFTVNQDVKVLQPNADIDNSEYLFQILRTQSNKIRQRCMKTGTTVESIETSFLKRFKLRVPPQEEQEEIADILSNLDKNVQFEKRHLSGLKELKRGLMQDFLTGKVRVNDISLGDN